MQGATSNAKAAEHDHRSLNPSKASTNLNASQQLTQGESMPLMGQPPSGDGSGSPGIPGGISGKRKPTGLPSPFLHKQEGSHSKLALHTQQASHRQA